MTLEIDCPRNKMAVKKLNLRIIKYSAIKKIANLVLPYSILKPETSSDSPSEKSKGVRFNSATADNLHKKNKGSNHNKTKKLLSPTFLKVT